ncbi:MAG TPA: hypothetical protein PK941_09815, partial [Paludibacter sp.]|nr:hypothetical protein [Paludibacter sp.]
MNDIPAYFGACRSTPVKTEMVFAYLLLTFFDTTTYFLPFTCRKGSFYFGFTSFFSNNAPGNRLIAPK